MEINIRQPREDELEKYFRACEAAFGYVPTADEIKRYSQLVESERLLIAEAGDEVVGAAGAYRFNLSVPGGDLPTAGVTQVGVLPSHRRRGVLTSLMAQQLKDARTWNEPIAALWCSEASIYGRYGYGMAGRQAAFEIEKDKAEFRNPFDSSGQVRLVELEDAMKLLPDVYERARSIVPGMPSRSGVWWRNHRLADDEDSRRGGGPMWRAVLEINGEPAAYALYRHHAQWGKFGTPEGHAQVAECVTTSDDAARTMWSYLLSLDLTPRIRADHEPSDSILLLSLKEIRRLGFVLKDGLWIRIVDIEQALSLRAYNGSGAVVFELRDSFCPWNRGRWKLTVRDGEGRVDPTTEDPDLSLSADALGSTYLGGIGFVELQRAGDISECAPGAVERADDLFRSARAPWCPEIF
jgi:predicted acetyltransferase